MVSPAETKLVFPPRSPTNESDIIDEGRILCVAESILFYGSAEVILLVKERYNFRNNLNFEIL